MPLTGEPIVRARDGLRIAVVRKENSGSVQAAPARLLWYGFNKMTSMILPARFLFAAALLTAAAGAPAAPRTPADAPSVSAANLRADENIAQAEDSRDARAKTAADAAREARREYGGKVLSVTREENGRQAYYRVKLLDNGHVRVVRISAD